MKLFSLASLPIVFGYAGSSDFYCENVLGDSFFNKCRMQYPYGLWTNLAQVIYQFSNPRALAIFSVCLLLVLPWLVLEKKPSSRSIQRFTQIQINILNFLHRLSYALILTLALYALFKQHSPCRCPAEKEMKYIGSIYGMPSGEAIAAGLLSGYLLDEGKYWSIRAYIVGALLIAWVCMERIVMGYASLGQVIVGALVGVMLHIYSVRVPQYAIFIDAIVETIFAFFLLYFDPTLSYFPHDPNNLNSWLIWGIAFELFTLLMIWRRYQDNVGLLKLSISVINQEMADYDRVEIIEEDIRPTHPDFKTASDSVYTFSSFLVLLLVLFLSEFVMQ